MIRNSKKKWQIWPSGYCIVQLLVLFRNFHMRLCVVTEEFTEKRETFAEKCKYILYRKFLKRQDMKTLHVLPWKLFTVASKQQNLLPSQKNKSVCTSKMGSGWERGLLPWSEWMMDIGCSWSDDRNTKVGKRVKTRPTAGNEGMLSTCVSTPSNHRERS